MLSHWQSSATKLLEWHAGDCASLQSGISYKWSDGSDTVYTQWDAADDEEDIVTGDCAYMDVSGGWRRADCETQLRGALCHGLPPSQCSFSETWTFLVSLQLFVFLFRSHHALLCLTGSKPFISYEVVCPSTWVKFGQSCYNFDTVVYKLTFEESRKHCRLKGRDL